MTTNELYNEWVEQVNKMSDEDRESLFNRVQESLKIAEASCLATNLYYSKALKQSENDCVYYGEGEYHVYMWLHADGTPFYVGSGKGYRWKSTNRNERFFEEAKKLDTWVCKLMDGLTQQQSREAEFCLSHYLSYNGYKLANWDNNYQRSVNERQADRRVGKFVRLMSKEYNKLTVEQAQKMMKPLEFECDYNMVLEQYTFKYGLPS
jgi:hypothetical protein